MSEDNPSCQLYLITPPKLVARDFAPVLESVLEAGPVASLMLRLDGASDDEWRAAALYLMPLCHHYGTAFIISRNVDLAKETGADGVHLTAQDMPIEEARRILGDDIIIGASARDSKHFAMEAGETGADYISFQPKTELIAWWAETMETPCVALGDITPEACAALAAAGADFVALSSIWDESDPVEAVTKFHKALEKITS